MMPRRVNYEKDLRGVFDKLVIMLRHVETAVEKSSHAFLENDIDRANEVIEESKQTSKLERKIQKACLKILVMEHPVAKDFREISSALKVITDLERIGDLARNISEITLKISESDYVKNLGQISNMATVVMQMLQDCVRAYIGRDIKLARSIDDMDDRVDELFIISMGEIAELIKKQPEAAELALWLFMITKYLERIGDHTVNVAQWIEYGVTGKYPKKKKEVEISDEEADIRD